MKIALLNLPVDNNYGGNLQRYALMNVLQNMGHEVVHINLRRRIKLNIVRKVLSICSRVIKKYLLGRNVVINYEAFANKKIKKEDSIIDEFYDRYINHTSQVYTIKELKKCIIGNIDAYMVGSDQVWRKDMTNTFGLDTFMFSFVPDNVRKYAYAISMGDAQMSFTEEELKTFCFLYNKFDKVSVREDVAQKKLLEMGCYTPYPEQVLDPSMLLSTQDYDFLIEKGATMSQTENKLFCYVLDISDSICEEINLMSSRYGVESVIVTLADGLSIEQWLRNIKDAKMILTDSYHGVVFSLLYNKQFKFIGNKRRGNSRVESLYSFLGVNSEEDLDWNHFNNILKIKRLESLNFLNLL